ncbi:hypothetical protein GFL85_27260 [Rhizobium laguerreae]|nr:hypothetical protein [Rhizobium laguerreae]
MGSGSESCSWTCKYSARFTDDPHSPQRSYCPPSCAVMAG